MFLKITENRILQYSALPNPIHNGRLSYSPRVIGRGGPQLADFLAMAPLAFQEWKSDAVMADAAVLSFVKVGHAEFCHALLDADKDFRVAHLATVPHRVLTV